MTTFRSQLHGAIHSALESRADCLALAEAGSTAFGRVDQLSDLDFAAIVDDGATGAVADCIASTIESLAKVERAYELPQPTWHGAWQTFYRIEGHPYTMVDFCIIEKSKEWTLTETERHGEPVILFDKVGAIKTTHLDPIANNDQIKAKIAKLEPMVNMFHDFVDKEVERGRLIDAVHFYIRMVHYPTIDALRMKYDPARHDFSARYLSFDLPENVAKEVETFFFIKDAADLLRKKKRAVELFNHSIASIVEN